MANPGDYRITTVEQLRGLIGQPYPIVKHKLLSDLDEMAIDFIKRSPFLLLASTSSPLSVVSTSACSQSSRNT
jgi:hypothetical protein